MSELFPKRNRMKQAPMQNAVGGVSRSRVSVGWVIAGSNRGQTCAAVQLL